MTKRSDARARHRHHRARSHHWRRRRHRLIALCQLGRVPGVSTFFPRAPSHLPLATAALLPHADAEAQSASGGCRSRRCARRPSPTFPTHCDPQERLAMGGHLAIHLDVLRRVRAGRLGHRGMCFICSCSCHRCLLLSQVFDDRPVNSPRYHPLHFFTWLPRHAHG